MGATKKMKISVTLSPKLIQKIDRFTKTHRGFTRSSVVQAWLESGSQIADKSQIEQETIAYYDSLSPQSLKDDSDWATQSSRQAKRLKID
jgi:metal-responsive CopG/Arc/MetJ family transcriptional regulator